MQSLQCSSQCLVNTFVVVTFLHNALNNGLVPLPFLHVLLLIIYLIYNDLLQFVADSTLERALRSLLWLECTIFLGFFRLAYLADRADVLIHFNVFVHGLVICITHALPQVELVLVEKIVQSAHESLVLFFLLLLLFYLQQSANTLAPTHPKAVVVGIELSPIVKDCKAREFSSMALRPLVLVLFFAFFLDSQELFVIYAPTGLFIFGVVAPVLEDIPRKLGVRTVAVQTAFRRTAAETDSLKVLPGALAFALLHDLVGRVEAHFRPFLGLFLHVFKYYYRIAPAASDFVKAVSTCQYFLPCTTPKLRSLLLRFP